jgi:hypothetical protein
LGVYWLAFKLHERGDPKARHDALLSRMVQFTETDWWIELGSLLVFESASDVDTISAAARSVVDDEYDLVMVGVADAMVGRLIGSSDDFASLSKILPRVWRA